MDYLRSLLFAIVCLQLVHAQDQPNIVFLFSDDAGYADFGFQGSQTMKTPNLDKLAKKGIRFTQGYVSDPTCGPSRAGLMTGRYQQRFGIEENNVPGYMSPVSAVDGPEMGLPLEEKTIGDYLQSLGYTTGYFGKWHLGGADRFHPTKRGYDEFVGFRGGARSYYAYPEDPAEPMNKLEYGFGKFVEPTGYLTDALGEEAISFIEKNKKKPFFAFVAFNAVHTPMHALPEDLAQFPQLEGKRQQVAAMTLGLDRACGKILDKLAELGLEDNTLIVFANDNGGPTDANASSNYPLSGTKATHLEGGIRIPFLMAWPGKIQPNSRYQYPIITLDLLPTFFSAAGGDADSLLDVDGVNLLPYLQDQKKERPHQRLYWKKEARAVIRHGDWKLIRYPDRPAELYNIQADEREMNNLADVYPEKVRKLYKMIFQWESTLEQPQWMLKRKYETFDLERQDAYRDQSLFFQEERD